MCIRDSIKAAEGGGAFIREQPGGKVIATLGNGATVTIFPNDFQEVDKVIWIHVFAIVNDVRVEGWMIQSVLITATPIADWQPSATSEFTCLLYTSPSPRDRTRSRMPSSA